MASSSDDSSSESEPAVTLSEYSLDSNRPSFSGTIIDPDAEITLTVEGVDYAAINNGDGTWELPENTIDALDEGDTELSITVTGTQGNIDTITETVEIDLIAVEVSVDSLITNDTTPTLTGVVNDPTAAIVVTLNGLEYNAVNNGDGTWTLGGDLVAELTEGEVTVTVSATDSAGNNDDDSGTVVVDITAPTVSLDSLITDDPTALLTGLVDDTEASVVVTVDSIDYQAVNNGDGTWSLPDNTLPELDEGETQITVTATDSANNSETIIDSVVVNSEQVEIGARSLVSGDTQPELTGVIEDPDARVVVTVKGIKCEAKNNGDGTWTLDSDDIPVLDEGSTSYTVTSIDDAGLRISTSSTVTVDLSAPEVSINSILTKDTTPALTGSVDDSDAIVTVTVNGEDYIAVNNGDGTWELNDNTLSILTEGVTEVTVSASDLLGNSGSSTGSITIDTIGVNVTFDSLVTNQLSPALSGSIDDATASVEVTVNGDIYEATNNEDGTWSLAAETLPDLTEGDVEVTVTASDEAGHTDSITNSIRVDLTAPVVTIDSMITTDTTPSISGTIDDPTATVVVSVTVDGEEYIATNNTDGTWTLADNTLPDLIEGETVVTVTASDAAGNSTTTTGSIDVDTVGLNVSLDSLTTNEVSPALSGSIDDITASVEVTVNGDIYEAINNEDGTWSLAADTLPDLTEGDVEITVTASDEAGHTDSITNSIRVDLTAPVVTIDSILTTDTTPSISGTIDDPTATVVVSVTVDGEEYIATNNTDGTWTLADNTLPDLIEGETVVTVTASDAAGNSTTTTGSIDVDTVGLNVSLDSLTTNEVSPALSGSIDDVTASVEVTVNGDIYEATNNEDGTWSIAADTLPDLVEGDVDVTVTASDEAGHTDSITNSISVDLTAPVVTIDSILTTDTTPSISGTIDDPTATVVVSVTVDGEEYIATNNTDGTWTLADNTLPDLIEGETVVTATASDAAGNSTTTTGSIDVDTVGLNVSLDSLTTNEVSPALSGSIDDISASVEVTVNGDIYEATNNEDGTWSLAADTLPDLTEGDVEVTVTASDEAGHTDSITNSISVDLTVPVVTIDSIITTDTTPSISGTIDDPTATVVVSVTVDGEEYIATNNTDGTWTLADNTLPDLIEGETVITATASDAAGNSTTTTGSIDVDTVGLNVSLDSLTTNEVSPALSGSIDDVTASVEVTVNGDIYEATNNEDGTWSIAADTLPDLVEGDVDVTVTASDEAGHTDSITNSISVDLTAPVVTIDSILTTDTTPSISGTIDDPTATVVVSVTVDGEEYIATNNTDGTWTLADNTLPDLIEGETVITATASDAAGNSTTTTGSIDVDTVGLNVSLDSLTTNEVSPALSGSIDDISASVEVTVNGDIYEATNNEDGTWSLAADTLPDLTEGDVEVTVTASDEAGHTDSITNSISVDLTVPVVTIDSIITTDTTPSISGTIDDPTATVVVSVTVDGEEYIATNNTDGTWTLADNTLPDLIEGETVITATASDAAGNSTTTTGSIDVDTVGLNVSLDSLTTNEVSPALSGSIDDVTASVEVTVNGDIYEATNNEDGTWSLAADTLLDLVEGDVDVTVTASDEAGHTDSITNSISVDLTAPVVTIDSIITTDTTPSISGTIDDPTATVVVSVTVEGEEYIATNNTDGTWTLADNTLPDLIEGETVITATASDAAGNSTTTTGSIDVDTVGLNVSLDSLTTNEVSPALSGSIDDVTASVEVTVNGDIYEATNNEDGTWSIAADTLPDLVEGDVDVTVTASDEAGHTDSITNSISVDLTAPVVTIDSIITTDTTQVSQALSMIQLQRL
ncbi:beta strand repeat-containing protein [Psychromonas sp. KJ10-2]|uniref:beta strand repeat-containing protein n=1 Tax=Psychromonas sp. KJ10-2 TaxID=3391822 RepID=UPI0039B6646C